MTPSAERHQVIVDTDAGLDDALALTYLAHHPSVDLVAVGSVHGNVPAPDAANNSLRVLELAGETVPPVAVGAEQPLQQPLHLGHPEDPVGALVGQPHRSPSDESAVDQLVRLARQHPGALTLLAIAPLTNIALALRAEPALPKLLHRIVIMGGALTTSGNITAHAESNIWHDPEAASAVLDAGFDCTLVPLDVTRQAKATRDWLANLATNRTQIWGQAATALIDHHDGTDLPPLPLHDPVAAALVTEPELATYDERRVRVALRGGARGRTTTEQSSVGPSVNVTTGVDVGVVLARLLNALSSAARSSA